MRGSLMRLATKQTHIQILTAHTDNREAAKVYQELFKKPVAPQNVAYWRSIFIDNAGKLATADNQLKQKRKLRTPFPDDDLGKLPNLDKVYGCVLVIPDQHMPYQHQDMLAFLAAVRDAFPIDLVVNLGDEVDHHAMSFHDSDPNLDSAGMELEKAKPIVRQLHDLFPIQLVCHSNHGSMSFRKAKAHGIPVQYLKAYREVLFPKGGGEGWSWADSWVIETPLGEVMFRHQSANILGDAAHNRCNMMVGHNHSRFEIGYCASRDYLYWGGYSGCLIDNDSYAYAYGRNTEKKPIIGCTVILEGRPVLIPMVLNTEGRWIGKL